MNLIASRALTMLLLALGVVACHSATTPSPQLDHLAQTRATPVGGLRGVAANAIIAATVVPSAEPTAPPPTRVPTTTPLPTLTPSPQPAVEYAKHTPDRLLIGSIQLDQPLVAVGLDPANAPVVPDHDVAWYNGSASPGDGENVVVWGHALRFRNAPDLPAPLERVRDAQVGDSVTLVTADGAAHEYVIAEQVWATPDQVSWILPTGDERLTIVNCIGAEVIDANGSVVSMTHRLITIARPSGS
jgi:sortase (surface protein transpeptidase)